MARSKRASTPLTERTDARGVVEIEAPGVRLSFPATNRSVMVIACTMVASAAAVCFALSMLATWAPAENLRSLGAVIARDGKDEGYRPAEAVPVQTDDGIEIIHACPPCDCAAECPACPPPLPCPQPTAAPPKLSAAQ